MKSWSTDIQQHIQYWSGHLGNLGWWPRYIYHFTDVQNAASILTEGILYCRKNAENQRKMIVDNASQEVIAQTKPEHTRFVRLYFRPRTPTQFRNEGIRPKALRELGSHCPVPIYFCFDAFELLSADNIEFSNGNMASNRAEHGKTREFFKQIPFEHVFHTGYFSAIQKDEIIFRRNAEVLVPDQLRLVPTLRFIACRSEAERQTLLHLLPYQVSNTWNDKIRLGEQGFFERKWTHVEEVVIFDRKLNFRFNPNTQTPGPFNVRVEYYEQSLSPPRVLNTRVDNLSGSFSVRPVNATWGEIRLYLDDALAYCDIVYFEDTPI